MHFSLPRFLRRVPSESLATYFEARGLNAVAKIQRSAAGQHGVERVRQAIEALPESEFLRIYDDFDRVSQLADDTGQLALHSMIGGASKLLEALSDVDSREGRALLVLLGQPDAFDRALSAAYTERLIDGKYWDRFRVLGFVSADAPLDLSETPVGVLLDLLEAGNGGVPARRVRERFPDAMVYLERIGAVQPDIRLTEVTCNECQFHHSAALEFDPSRHAYRFFCPEAGFVMVADADVAGLRVSPAWLGGSALRHLRWHEATP
jgi:hypothetical protein